MTHDERIAFDLLQLFNYAILRRIAPGEYTVFGRAPAFYDALFPSVAGVPCADPWTASPMLEFFLGEAEDFFALDKPGSINSGVWEEEGRTRENTALSATAVNLGEAQIIIIRLLQEEYAERLSIMRKVREQLLENRQLTNNLSIFKEKSRIDGLTSIFNRATFIELLLDEIKRSQILDYPLPLLVLDIDDFKQVNDNYGHLTGDKLLKNMGAKLQNSLRRNDIVARYGGEEFVVLLPHASLKEAMRIAEVIRVNLASMIVPGVPSFTVSIGCTAYSPGESPDDFFKRADEALYAAKHQGKNRVCAK